MGRNASILAALALATVAAAGCTNITPTGDKAGGREGQVVLRLANTSYGPGHSLAYFVKQVAVISGGHAGVQVVNQFGGYAPDAEVQVVQAVASGKVDLGWVGSQVFDSMGVSSLSALSAPMLIDSYSLESAVLESQMTKQMLDGLRAIGVTGLAASPGALHVPLSVDHPLVAPADWRGISFGTYRSQVQERTIRALGATPVEAFGILRSHALDAHSIQGFELGVQGYERLGLVTQAPYVALNLVLWPGVDVVFANPNRLLSLTRQQRGWLEDAAMDTAKHMALIGNDVTASIQAACAEGARFVTAEPAQLDALRSTLSTVYDELERDAPTKSFIEQIQRLKTSTPPDPAPHIPASCSGSR